MRIEELQANKFTTDNNTLLDDFNFPPSYP
jgi:hypothetical protein